MDDLSDPGALRMEPEHVPVLREQTLDLLAPREGEVFVDATCGLGGHAAMVAARLGPRGLVVLNDLDPSHLPMARDRVRRACPDGQAPRIEALHGSFALLGDRLIERGIRCDMLLADLGFSSDQVDDPSRGFSFREDGPLDMRLDPTSGVPARVLVNELPERELADLIYRFGEERASRRIARRIVEARQTSPIETTGQLSMLVREVMGGIRGRIDPATRTFQALRIAVNDELGALERLLGAIESQAAMDSGDARRWLAPGARVVIIAFHSLEDRPVKRAFRGMRERGLCELLTRRAVQADEREIAQNRRARSARLRAIRLLAPGEAGRGAVGERPDTPSL